jgi:hypothetical protein
MPKLRQPGQGGDLDLQFPRSRQQWTYSGGKLIVWTCKNSANQHWSASLG